MNIRIGHHTAKVKTILLGGVFITSILNIVEIGGVSLLTVLTILFSIVAGREIFANKSFSLKKDRQVILPILLILLAWASCIWTQNLSVTISKNYSYTILPLYYIVTVLTRFDKKDLKTIDLSIIVGGYLYVAYVLITQGFGAILSGRFATTAEMDQNATCATLFLILVVCIKCIGEKRSAHKKAVSLYPLTLMILWLFLMTGSRGGLVALAAFMVVLCVGKGKYKILRIAGIVVLALAAVYFIAPKVLPENIYARLFQTDSYKTTISSTKNRVAIWTYCVEYLLPGMPVLGYGSGVAPYLIGPKFGYVQRAIHNTYFAIFLDYGVTGVILLMGMLIGLLKDSIKHKRLYCVGAMLGIMIIIFFLDAYYRTYLWSILVYCSLQIGYAKRSGE